MRSWNMSWFRSAFFSTVRPNFPVPPIREDINSRESTRNSASQFWKKHHFHPRDFYKRPQWSLGRTAGSLASSCRFKHRKPQINLFPKENPSQQNLGHGIHHHHHPNDAKAARWQMSRDKISGISWSCPASSTQIHHSFNHFGCFPRSSLFKRKIAKNGGGNISRFAIFRLGAPRYGELLLNHSCSSAWVEEASFNPSNLFGTTFSGPNKCFSTTELSRSSF